MASQNKTAEFLGHPYSWNKAKLELRDVQPLHGGVIVQLPGWTHSEAFVTRVAPGGAETKYRLHLQWLDGEKETLIGLCVEHDFLTIQPEMRLGIPDEARPSLTLTNAKRESHTVAKWAGVADARFDAIYQAMLALANRSKQLKLVPERFNGWQKTAVIIMIVAGLLLLSLPGYAGAQAVAQALWPERVGLLLVLLLHLLALLLAGVAGLSWWERRIPRWARTYTHWWVLAGINLCFFLSCLGAWGLAETAVSIWRSEGQPLVEDEQIWYAVLGYSGVFTAVLLIIAAGRIMPLLLNLIDERF